MAKEMKKAAQAAVKTAEVKKTVEAVKTKKAVAKKEVKETVRKVIQWTNKFSGEQGFVKCLNRKDEYFENTWEKSEAQKFAASAIKQTINLLDKFESNNTYCEVDA